MRLALALLLAAPASLPAQPGADGPFPPFSRPALVGHRGGWEHAPRNSLEACRAALAHGVDFIHVDLQVTKDHALVCLSHINLEWTTNVMKIYPERGRGIDPKKKSYPVYDFTLAEIRKLELKAFHPQYRGARVASLEDVLDVVKGKAGLMPELKTPFYYSNSGFPIEKLLVASLRRKGLAEPNAAPKTPIVILSPEFLSLRELRQGQGCKLPLLCVLGKDATTSKEALAKLKPWAEGFAISRFDLLRHRDLIKVAHELGMSVGVHTFLATNEAKFDELRKDMRHHLRLLKADAVFTSNPDLFPRD